MCACGMWFGHVGVCTCVLGKMWMFMRVQAGVYCVVCIYQYTQDMYMWKIRAWHMHVYMVGMTL